MAFKVFLIISLLCAVQLAGSVSKLSNSKYVQLFYEYYKVRDNFAEAVTLYGLYSKLEQHKEYTKISSCYSEYFPSYGYYLMGILMNNMTLTANSLEKEETALPLNRLIMTLANYPTNLKTLIYNGKYDQAMQLMRETRDRTIFFDIRYNMVTDKEKRNNPEFTGTEYSIYLKYRENAKKFALYLTESIIYCIIDSSELHEAESHDVFYDDSYYFY